MPNPRNNKKSVVLPNAIEGFKDFGHLNLPSINNARDLGGMRAGKYHIARRRLIRTGSLTNASREDLNLLMDSRDVECVVDLRTEVEVRDDPDPRQLMRGVGYLHLPVFDHDATGLSGNTTSQMKTLGSFLDNAFDIICDIYEKSVLEEPALSSFKSFFNELLSAKSGATLFHCTQGKDRTGICAWLVEAALGVSEPDRHADYLATNLFIDGVPNKVQRMFGSVSRPSSFSRAALAYGYAHDAYYRAFTEAINKNFGGVKEYLRDALDLRDDGIAQLQHLYLV